MSGLVLDLDLDPLWSSINNFFPIFFGVLSVAGGLAIALQLGEFLIDKIRGAFR